MLDNYFIFENNTTTKTSLLIKDRKNRTKVLNLIGIIHVTTGDILAVIFWKEAIIYRFQGVCISIKNKSLSRPDTTVILRNVILGIGVEFLVSYYYNRTYSVTILDFKRKKFVYKKSKLFYLRKKLNRASRVK